MSKQSYFKRSKPMEGAQKHSLHPNNTIFQKGSIYDSELEECLCLRMIDPKSGLLGCFEGTSGLFRFTVDESQSESFVLEQIWREGNLYDMVHYSSKNITFLYEAKNKSLYRIDNQLNLSRVMKADSCVFPGKCLKMDAAQTCLYVQKSNCSIIIFTEISQRGYQKKISIKDVGFDQIQEFCPIESDRIMVVGAKGEVTLIRFLGDFCGPGNCQCSNKVKEAQRGSAVDCQVCCGVQELDFSNLFVVNGEVFENLETSSLAVCKGYAAVAAHDHGTGSKKRLYLLKLVNGSSFKLASVKSYDGGEAARTAYMCMNLDFEINGDPVLVAFEHCPGGSFVSYVIRNNDFVPFQTIENFSRGYVFSLGVVENKVWTVDSKGLIQSLKFESIDLTKKTNSNNNLVQNNISRKVLSSVEEVSEVTRDSRSVSVSELNSTCHPDSENFVMTRSGVRIPKIPLDQHFSPLNPQFGDSAGKDPIHETNESFVNLEYQSTYTDSEKPFLTEKKFQNSSASNLKKFEKKGGFESTEGGPKGKGGHRDAKDPCDDSNSQSEHQFVKNLSGEFNNIFKPNNANNKPGYIDRDASSMKSGSQLTISTFKDSYIDPAAQRKLSACSGVYDVFSRTGSEQRPKNHPRARARPEIHQKKTLNGQNGSQTTTTATSEENGKRRHDWQTKFAEVRTKQQAAHPNSPYRFGASESSLKIKEPSYPIISGSKDKNYKIYLKNFESFSKHGKETDRSDISDIDTVMANEFDRVLNKKRGFDKDPKIGNSENLVRTCFEEEDEDEEMAVDAEDLVGYYKRRESSISSQNEPYPLNDENDESNINSDRRRSGKRSSVARRVSYTRNRDKENLDLSQKRVFKEKVFRLTSNVTSRRNTNRGELEDEEDPREGDYGYKDPNDESCFTESQFSEFLNPPANTTAKKGINNEARILDFNAEFEETGQPIRRPSDQSGRSEDLFRAVEERGDLQEDEDVYIDLTRNRQVQRLEEQEIDLEDYDEGQIDHSLLLGLQKKKKRIQYAQNLKNRQNQLKMFESEDIENLRPSGNLVNRLKSLENSEGMISQTRDTTTLDPEEITSKKVELIAKAMKDNDEDIFISVDSRHLKNSFKTSRNTPDNRGMGGASCQLQAKRRAKSKDYSVRRDEIKIEDLNPAFKKKGYAAGGGGYSRRRKEPSRAIGAYLGHEGGAGGEREGMSRAQMARSLEKNCYSYDKENEVLSSNQQSRGTRKVSEESNGDIQAGDDGFERGDGTGPGLGKSCFPGMNVKNSSLQEVDWSDDIGHISSVMIQTHTTFVSAIAPLDQTSGYIAQIVNPQKLQDEIDNYQSNVFQQHQSTANRPGDEETAAAKQKTPNKDNKKPSESNLHEFSGLVHYTIDMTNKQITLKWIKQLSNQNSKTPIFDYFAHFDVDTETLNDIVCFPEYHTLLGVNPQTLNILRLNTLSNKLDTIGSAWRGEYPGRTFRKTPSGSKLLILTKKFKISAFKILNKMRLSRAGSVLLSLDSSIIDFTAVGEDNLAIATSSQLYFYQYGKEFSDLVSFSNLSERMLPDEQISSLVYAEAASKLFVAFFDKRSIQGTRLCTFGLVNGKKLCLNTITSLDGGACRSPPGVVMKMSIWDEASENGSKRTLLVCHEATGDCRLRVYRFLKSGLNLVVSKSNYCNGPCYASELVGSVLVSQGVNGEMRMSDLMKIQG